MADEEIVQDVAAEADPGVTDDMLNAAAADAVVVETETETEQVVEEVVEDLQITEETEV